MEYNNNNNPYRNQNNPYYSQNPQTSMNNPGRSMATVAMVFGSCQCFLCIYGLSAHDLWQHSHYFGHSLEGLRQKNADSCQNRHWYCHRRPGYGNCADHFGFYPPDVKRRLSHRSGGVCWMSSLNVRPDKNWRIIWENPTRIL